MAQTNEFTGIRVDTEVWQYVHNRMRPDESKNETLRRLLNLEDSAEEQPV